MRHKSTDGKMLVLLLSKAETLGSDHVNSYYDTYLRGESETLMMHNA